MVHMVHMVVQERTTKLLQTSHLTAGAPSISAILTAGASQRPYWTPKLQSFTERE